MRALLVLLFLASVSSADLSERVNEEVCIALDDSEYSDYDNGTLVYMGDTLDVIGNDTNGRPIVCTTAIPRLANEYPTILVVQEILVGPASVVFNLGTIIAYEGLRCGTRTPLQLLDIAFMNFNAALIITNSLLILEGPIMQLAPNVSLCQHVALFLHFSFVYQFLAFACLSVELARVVSNKKDRKKSCPLLVYLAISVMIPTVIVVITLSVNIADTQLVLYGKTLDNMLKCWTNNTNAFIVTTVLPSVLALIPTPFTTGAAMYNTLLRIGQSIKQSRRRNRNETQQDQTTDTPTTTRDERPAQALTTTSRASLGADFAISKKQQIFDTIAMFICYVTNTMSLVIIIQIVLTDPHAESHILRMFQLIQSAAIFVATLANPNVRAGLGKLCRDTRNESLNTQESSSSSASDRMRTRPRRNRSGNMTTGRSSSRNNKSVGKNDEDGSRRREQVELVDRVQVANPVSATPQVAVNQPTPATPQQQYLTVPLPLYAQPASTKPTTE